jgi:hypothetical protein
MIRFLVVGGIIFDSPLESQKCILNLKNTLMLFLKYLDGNDIRPFVITLSYKMFFTFRTILLA